MKEGVRQLPEFALGEVDITNALEPTGFCDNYE